MIGKFLVAWFAEQAAITAILGTNPLRLWPAGNVPQSQREVYPRAMFQQIGGQDVTGELTRGGNVWHADYQIQLVGRGAQDYATVQALKTAIVGVYPSFKLHYYTGTMAGVEVVKALLDNEIDSSTPPDDASQYTIQEITLDFRFFYVRG